MKSIRFMILFILTAAILMNSTLILENSSAALILWFEKLLPSVFVSMVFIRLWIFSPAIKNFIQPLQRPIKWLFNLDLDSFILAFGSLLIGFPGGAIMINEELKQNHLTPDAAKRLIYCCSIASLSFVAAGIGATFYHSFQIGLKLYILQLATSFLLLFFTRRQKVTFIQENNEKTFFNQFSIAIFATFKTLIMIVAYLMIIFSLTSILIQYLPVSWHFPLKTICEFSSGSINISTSHLTLFEKLFLTSNLLAFGGFAIHLQIMGSCIESELSYLTFLNYRIFQCIIVSCFILILFQFNTL